MNNRFTWDNCSVGADGSDIPAHMFHRLLVEPMGSMKATDYMGSTEFGTACIALIIGGIHGSIMECVDSTHFMD